VGEGVPHNARMRTMSINVDWLGDGWTYYTNEERQAMEAKKNQQEAEQRRQKAMNQLAVECVAWSCVPIPLRLAVKLLPAIDGSLDLTEQESQDVMGLVVEFASMIREANAVNKNYSNN